jgi:hypothetical protein
VAAGTAGALLEAELVLAALLPVAALLPPPPQAESVSTRLASRMPWIAFVIFCVIAFFSEACIRSIVNAAAF